MGVLQTILEARSVSKGFFGNPVLREVSIAWQIGRRMAHALGAKTATAVVAARNVAIQTFGFTSWDPENVTGSTDASNFNFVQQAQPLTLVLRVNLGF